GISLPSLHDHWSEPRLCSGAGAVVSVSSRPFRHILIDTRPTPAQVGGPASRLHMRPLAGFVLAAAVASASSNTHTAAAQAETRMRREPPVWANQVPNGYGGDDLIM